MRYDPTEPPVPSEWLEADEGERLDAVLRHHRRARIRRGNVQAHSAIHVAVETQLAEGLQAAVRAMARLTEGGLDRHEAIHAIGSVVAEQLYEVLHHQRAHDPEAYAVELDRLTAESWRRSGGEG
jgi:hypothetical protein